MKGVKEGALWGLMKRRDLIRHDKLNISTKQKMKRSRKVPT